jgi:regulator of protease activity HflC (stomatin/prohibitin superfamily)
MNSARCIDLRLRPRNPAHRRTLRHRLIEPGPLPVQAPHEVKRVRMNIIVLIAFIAAGIAIAGFRICQEYERAVVFRLGRFQAVRGPGWYWNIPLAEWQRKLDLRTCTVDIEQQETVSRDSVTIKVNAVLWFRIFDPERAVIAVQNFESAVYQVALTSLRNIIGQHDLDDVLKSRDRINQTLRGMVDAATHPWGLTVEMVEMKDVEIPVAMQRAMAREAEAVREKRARIIKAEAELESSLKLRDASVYIAQNPAALELRRMQMVSEVGAEHNTTTVLMLPSDFMTLAKSAGDYLRAKLPAE